MSARAAALAAALSGALWPGAAAAQVPGPAFLPPAVTARDLCPADGAAAVPVPGPHADPAAAAAPEPAAARTIAFIERDIRRLSAEDPGRHFDHIRALIAWKARLDPGFAGPGALLAEIALHVDAGRLDELARAGLVDALARGPQRITNPQRLELARYYLNGVGTAQDVAFGQSLIREAAFRGNADALLAVARMAAAGEPLPGWDAPPALTATLALGAMLGALDGGVCARAERIAREYETGQSLAADPAAARAWYRFAADLGSGRAAWRLVELALALPEGERDAAAIRADLARAVSRGFVPDPAQAARLLAAGLAEGTGGTAPGGIAALLRLVPAPAAGDPAAGGARLAYLRDATRLPGAPGPAFTELAREVLARRGRWAGEAEAMAALEQAAARGDGEGRRLLARLLVRGRRDRATLDRAADLLAEAADLGGVPAALGDLAVLHGCQAPDAPRSAEAGYWARAAAAAGVGRDLADPATAATLDPAIDPWAVAALQGAALDGVPRAVAAMARRAEAEPGASPEALAVWAGRLQSSPRALEAYALAVLAAARTPPERSAALGLLARVALHNGPASALDLAGALVAGAAGDPAVADEARGLLATAAARGEGAAIRLLARLGPEGPDAVLARYRGAIAARGDFVALAFAIPRVDEATAADYLDRAVALVETCGTREADELGEAAAARGWSAESEHWRRVALAVEGGNALGRLGLGAATVARAAAAAAPDRRAAAAWLARRGAAGDAAAAAMARAAGAAP